MTQGKIEIQKPFDSAIFHLKKAWLTNNLNVRGEAFDKAFQLIGTFEDCQETWHYDSTTGLDILRKLSMRIKPRERRNWVSERMPLHGGGKFQILVLAKEKKARTLNDALWVWGKSLPDDLEDLIWWYRLIEKFRRSLVSTGILQEKPEDKIKRHIVWDWIKKKFIKTFRDAEKAYWQVGYHRPEKIESWRIMKEKAQGIEEKLEVYIHAPSNYEKMKAWEDLEKKAGNSFENCIFLWENAPVFDCEDKRMTAAGRIIWRIAKPLAKHPKEHRWIEKNKPPKEPVHIMIG